MSTTRITAGGLSIALPASPQPSTARPGAGAGSLTVTEPSVIVVDPDAAPLTPLIRYRVWREMADPTRPYFQDRFYVQTSTLAAAAEIEDLLELYDGWQDRAGDSDIETWDGTEWSDGLSDDDAAVASAVRKAIGDLADVLDPDTSGGPR